MDIEIKNEENVIVICERVVRAYIPKMNNDIISLNSALTRIKIKWQSNGMDKESYILELEKQNKNLETLNDVIVQLFNSILVYVETIRKTSSNTLDIVIGNNIGDYNVTMGYNSAYQAMNNKDAVKLNAQYVNSDSTFKAFAVVNSNGTLQEVEHAGGTNLNQFMQENGYELDDIVVDIAKDGQSQAWIPAKDFVKNNT